MSHAQEAKVRWSLKFHYLTCKKLKYHLSRESVKYGKLRSFMNFVILIAAIRGVWLTFVLDFLSVQRHAFLYHEGAARKVFPCTICKKEFSRPDKMKQHLKQAHEGGGGGGASGAKDKSIKAESGAAPSGPPSDLVAALPPPPPPPLVIDPSSAAVAVTTASMAAASMTEAANAASVAAAARAAVAAMAASAMSGVDTKTSTVS